MQIPSPVPVFASSPLLAATRPALPQTCAVELGCVHSWFCSARCQSLHKNAQAFQSKGMLFLHQVVPIAWLGSWHELSLKENNLCLFLSHHIQILRHLQLCIPAVMPGKLNELWVPKGSSETGALLLIWSPTENVRTFNIRKPRIETLETYIFFLYSCLLESFF